MKILLTGKNGQIGLELQHSLAGLGDVVALGHQEMDLANPSAIIKIVRELRPDLIVNAAAYTAVDRAEDEPDIAMAINGVAPGILADEAKRLGAGLIHYSTDYVFDGSKSQPYAEDDKPTPLNIYGKSKLMGEQAVQSSSCNHLIFRTSWVYSPNGKNFLLTMLQLLKEREDISVVNDQVGAPTCAKQIAEHTAAILKQKWHEKSGLYHMTAHGHTSWHGFAEKIKLLTSSQCQISPITSAEYPTKAIRPANSRLALEKLETFFNISPQAWDIALANCIYTLAKRNSD